MEWLGAHDSGMLYFFLRMRQPWMEGPLVAVTHLGDLVVLAGMVLSGVTILLALRRSRLALALLLAGLLALGLDVGGKQAVGRPRPQAAERVKDYPLPDQPSFPSGHALGSMAVYGSLGLLLARAWRKRPAPFVVCGVVLSLVVGLSRVMIGVHYPLDVLAGWVAGLLCVCVAALLAGPDLPAAGADQAPV